MIRSSNCPVDHRWWRWSPSPQWRDELSCSRGNHRRFSMKDKKWNWSIDGGETISSSLISGENLSPSHSQLEGKWFPSISFVSCWPSGQTSLIDNCQSNQIRLLLDVNVLERRGEWRSSACLRELRPCAFSEDDWTCFLLTSCRRNSSQWTDKMHVDGGETKATKEPVHQLCVRS